MYLKELPEALCDLYNLQTLDVSYSSSLRKLPQRIGKLINLRHLITEGITLSCMPKGMERLTSLRSLRNFFVGSGDHGNKACTLECLENLNNLRGSLALHGLGNVKNVDDVKKANLRSKKNILHLRLTFDKEEVQERINAENEVVLQALQPPPNLEKLTIWAYGSSTISTSIRWMMLLTKLRILQLHYCENWVNLPSLGKLPSLESLVISNMKSLRRLGKEFLGIESGESCLSSSSAIAFPKLKSLKFQRMEEWEEWGFDLLVSEDITIMPCLDSLEFYSCYKLKALPDYLLQKTTLEQLVLYECTELEKRYQEGKGEDCHKISHIPQVRIVISSFSEYDERYAWSFNSNSLSDDSENEDEF